MGLSKYAAAAVMMTLAARSVGAEELTGTLKKVKETGTIILGYRESSVPFSYMDGDQKPVGYSLDICYRIVDAVKARLGLDKLEVKLSPVSSAIRIPLIANGTIDIECGSTTNTIERNSQVAFTNTDFLTATRYVSLTAPADRVQDSHVELLGVRRRDVEGRVRRGGEWSGLHCTEGRAVGNGRLGRGACRD